MSSKPSNMKSHLKTIDKASISQPSNFVHVEHKGADLPKSSPHGELITSENKPSLPPPCRGNMNSEKITSHFQADMMDEIVKSVRHEIKNHCDEILRDLTDKMQKEIISHIQTPCPVCKHLSGKQQEELTHDTDKVEYVNINNDKPGIFSEKCMQNKDRSLPVDVNDTGTTSDETHLKCVISNPTNNEADTDVILPTEMQEIGFLVQDSRKKPVPLPRVRKENISFEPHSSIPHPRSLRGTARRKTDERECLARAFQTHVIEIVDGVVFQESELPDMLTKDGVLTEDECSNIRRISDRKDQIRQLLSLIKGRDLPVLKKFLTRIEKHNQSVAESIKSRFEKNIRDNVQAPTTCVICKLQSRVNIKYIIDRLWTIPVIEDGLYNEVIYCHKPTGAQKELWECLIDALNGKNETEKRGTFAVLNEALVKHGHYNHIARAVEMQVQGDGQLKHTCMKLSPISNDRVSSASSISPRSSCDYSERCISESRSSGELLSAEDHETKYESLNKGRQQKDGC